MAKENNSPSGYHFAGSDLHAFKCDLSQANHALIKGLWQGDLEGVSASQTPGTAERLPYNCPLGGAL